MPWTQKSVIWKKPDKSVLIIFVMLNKTLIQILNVGQTSLDGCDKAQDIGCDMKDRHRIPRQHEMK